jgi:hypothetical protein
MRTVAAAPIFVADTVPEPALMPAAEPAPPMIARRRTLFYLLRRFARKTDTLILWLLNVSPPNAAIEVQTPVFTSSNLAGYSQHRTGTVVTMLHPSHSTSGPHRLGRTYIQLRSFARKVDSALRVAKNQFEHS